MDDRTSKQTYSINLLTLNNFRINDRVYDLSRHEHGRVVGIEISMLDGMKKYVTVLGEHTRTTRTGYFEEFCLPLSSYEPTFERKDVVPDSDTPDKQPGIGPGLAEYLARRATGHVDVVSESSLGSRITRADLTVVMITTDRKPSYVKETWDRLRRSERNSAIFDTHNFQLFLDNEHNPAANVARALKWASEQSREWILFLEDDLLFCDRFIDSVAAWLSHNCCVWDSVLSSPIYLLGSAAITADKTNAVGARGGFYRSSDANDFVGFGYIPLRNFYGTQAFAIRRAYAASLARYIQDHGERFDPGKYDLTIVEWCRATYSSVTNFVASIPSFVQHIGAESSIRPGEPSFTFPSFPGEGWSYVKTDDKKEVCPPDCAHCENCDCNDCDPQIEMPEDEAASVTRAQAPEIKSLLSSDSLGMGRFLLSGVVLTINQKEAIKSLSGLVETLEPEKAGCAYCSGLVTPSNEIVIAYDGDTFTFCSATCARAYGCKDYLDAREGAEKVGNCSVCADNATQGIPPEVAHHDGDLSHIEHVEFTTSRRVRAEDFSADWFRAIIAEMDEPLKMHRKLWEYAVIAKVYLERIDPTFSDAGRLMYQRRVMEDLDRNINSPVRRPRVLGFGVGHDPLPAWFAMRGAEVVATDKPAEDTIKTWKSTGQHAAGKDQLRRSKGTTDEDWRRVCFIPHDMTQEDNLYRAYASSITDDNGQGYFDLTFSCGSFEHIGGLAASMDFFVRQMAFLKPGGVAVHTTEYSINHNRYDSADLCLFRSRDIAILARRLAEQGDLLLPFDSTPGTSSADCYIDQPPYVGNITTPNEDTLHAAGLKLGSVGPWHLNMALTTGHVTTSIVLIAIRDGIRLEKEKQTPTREEMDRAVFGDGPALRRFYDMSPNRRGTKPSVLFLGDAVVSSGFAKSTHGVCAHLHLRGWNVRVIGMNYYGAQDDLYGWGPHQYPYHIHPAFEPLSGPASPDGATLLPRMIYDYSPDVIVIQQDPWNIPAYLSAIDQAFLGTGRSVPPIVGFLAVDGENQPGTPLNRLAAVITWTEFGMDQLRVGGYYGPGYVVPLGVDTDTFRPLDRKSIRAEFAASVSSMPGKLADDIDPETAFIVGFVGRNQPRKRLDLLLQSYARWVHDAEHGGEQAIANTLLYLHVGPTGDAGFDLPSLIRYLGLDGRVIINSPEIGQGDSESDLCRRYNLFDVFVTCSQGEGFWLPGFEAAACGVPIIAPDHSAFREFFRGTINGIANDFAHLVPSSFAITSAPHNGAMRTLGGLVDPREVALALDASYCLRAERDRLAENGLDMASKFTWERTGKSFEAALRGILGLI